MNALLPKGPELSARSKWVSWPLQIVAAGILAQTLFFKFTGAPEAVYIFSTLGVEPWGRLGLGVFELVAAVALLVPRTAVFGAILSAGLMVGAIGSHLGPLGIEIRLPDAAEGDGGTLFVLAIVVLLSSASTVAIRRRQVFATLAPLLARVRVSAPA